MGLLPAAKGVGEAPSRDGPTSATRRTRLVVLVLLVLAEVTWLASLDVAEGTVRWGPVVLVVALHLGLVCGEHRRPVLGTRPVLVATAVVGLAAVVVPPSGSLDVYLYATYGRMATWHHLNPYLFPPDAVPDDALFVHMAQVWRSMPTAYGPLFTAWSAVGALVYGDSPLRARLFFQASAAGALLAGTLYLHRRGRPTALLAAVGLSPVLVASAHGGHTDLMAGLLALVGIDLVVRRRPDVGALLVGLAVAVKVSLLPVAGVVVLAAIVARRRREAVRSAATIGGVLVGGYLAVGGLRALAPLRNINQAVSRGSLWATLARNPQADQLLRSEGWAHPLAALVMVVALGVLAWRARRPIDVVVLATAAGVVVCFGADYTLPWYASSFLLLAALAPSVPARALVVGSTVQLLVYVQAPGAPVGEVVGAANVALLGGAALGCLLVGTVAWVVVTGRLWRRSRPPGPDPSAPERPDVPVAGRSPVGPPVHG